MSSLRGADFMFCDLCGTMLQMTSTTTVACPLCKFKKNFDEVRGRKTSYKVTNEDMRRYLGISHFEGKMEVKDMEVLKKCEKCGHPKLTFTTRQIRSADEGQTTFFHCPNCSHTFTED